MLDLARQEIAATARTVLIKVGTRVLTRDDGSLDGERIARLAGEVAGVVESGRRALLVSSGAVGAGVSRLGLPGRPRDLAKLQAVAAVGQTHLIETYERTFRDHGLHAAQVLLTADDLDNRQRYLNVRNTLLALLDAGVVPIINENDTIAVDELATTFGDNDRLAAMVTNLLRAPLMIILSDVEGLFDRDPSDPAAAVVATVARIDDAVLDLARARPSSHGMSKGGMASKLAAARMVTAAGENVVIASGKRSGVISAILRGETVGTLFLAEGKSMSPWKRWIGYSARPAGTITLDAGACAAIAAHGRSLLPIGIAGVTGAFQKGDVVSLANASGREIARGLTNYGAADVLKIMGRKTEQIRELLGYHPYDEVVHRDNLIVTAAGH